MVRIWGKKTWKHGSILPCLNGSGWWWCSGCGGHLWRFYTAWYGTVRFGTVHFWGVFHWVLYLVLFSTTSAGVPSDPYRYQNVTCKLCWSLIGRRESSLLRHWTCDMRPIDQLDLNQHPTNRPELSRTVQYRAVPNRTMQWKSAITWHTLVPIEHSLNATAYLSIGADHPFMTTVYTSSDGYFQQDNAPCHKAQIISDWFLEHDNEFTLLK